MSYFNPQYNPYQNGRYSNPYAAQYPRPNYPKYEIIHVNGENGAKSLQMAENSNALLLDDTAPVVWLAQTDGAGYKTVTPYSITPLQQETPVDIRSLEKRIEALEAKINAKSDTTESSSKLADGGSAKG